MQNALNFILLMLASLLVAGGTQDADSAFERLKRSVPEREAGWKVVQADKPRRQSDGSIHACFVWANGAEEARAAVILHESLKAAENQFKHSGPDEHSMAGFLIDGIGDEAYLLPPIILGGDGPFNLRFRKGRYEIFMSSNSKETVRRCAEYVIESISPQSRGKQGGGAELRRGCLALFSASRSPGQLAGRFAGV